MPELNLEPDAITFSSVISALAKGKQWLAALEVVVILTFHPQRLLDKSLGSTNLFELLKAVTLLCPSLAYGRR